MKHKTQIIVSILFALVVGIFYITVATLLGRGHIASVILFAFIIFSTNCIVFVAFKRGRNNTKKQNIIILLGSLFVLMAILIPLGLWLW